MEKNKKNGRKYIFINCSLIGAILLAIIAGLIEVNTGISYSLAMQKNNSKLKELRLENERLSKEMANYGSMDNLYTLSHDLNMVKTSEINYLVSAGEGLAVKH